MPGDEAGGGEREAQRIDRWLWFARMVKSRSRAARLVAAGRIRLNGRRILKPSQAVRPGDVLTFMLARRLRVLEVAAVGARRGPAQEAQALYRDLSPQPAGGSGEAPEPSGTPALRRRGEGRPTKRDRRRIAAWAGHTR